MPRRNDLHRILVIGSGPIVIGQAAEFDYSGTQAIKALREEGYEVVLVNSNPATIMTDPEFADRTYIEPVTTEFVARIIERERPDAVLPTMGGQTALNVALALHDQGVLERFGCELIGANARAIRVAEDRKLFGEAMVKIGLKCPDGRIATSWGDALAIADWSGFPAIIRPAFTLGGSGGGVAYNREEYEQVAKAAIVNLSRSMAIDFGPMGIRTNCICPGAIATPAVMKMFTDERRAAMEAATPLGRMGRPGDIASVAVFLASQDAAFINGTTIVADGGLMARTGMPV